MAEGQLVQFGDQVKLGGDSKEVLDGATGFLGIKRILTATETKDWASIAATAQAIEDVTVTGAALGDLAFATMSVTLKDGTNAVHGTMTAYVSAANTVTVILANCTTVIGGLAVDLASGTLRVVVFDIT